jgi:hypothetical protein
MRRPLHLASHDRNTIIRSGFDSGTPLAVNHCHTTWTRQRRHDIPGNDAFDGLVGRSITHQNRRTGLHALQIVRPTLIGLLVVLVRHRAEFHCPVGAGNAPCLELRIVARARSEDFGGFLLEAFDLRKFPPEDDRVRVMFARQTTKK